MTKITEEQRAAFLDDLTALTRKHGIEISGCGCCDSPVLTTVDDPAGHYSVRTPGQHDDGCVVGNWLMWLKPGEERDGK